MSEAAEHDAEDLSDDDIPMDADQDEADGDAEEDDGDDEGPAAGGPKKAKADEGAADGGDLAPEEVRRRYQNTQAALREERGRRRTLEREREEMTARIASLERGERPADRQEQRQEVEEIDPDVDPVGALKQMRAKIAAYEQAERLESETEAQRQQREVGLQRVERQLAEHEADFRDEAGDYDEAAKHYAVARAQELMQFGLSPARIQPMLREEFVNLAETAIRAKKNPAAVIYALAKGRGYGKAAEPKSKDGQTKLKDIARGAKATSALQNGGGRASSGVDVEALSRINIRDPAGREAFEREFAKMEREARAGGRRR